MECNRISGLSPYAIKVIADTVHSEDPRLSFSAAIKICEIAGVSGSGGIQRVLETTAADQEQEQEQKRLAFRGLMLEHILNMSETYKMPLPKGFVEQARQIADRAAEVEKEVGTEADEEAALSKGRVRPTPLSSSK